MRVLITGGAGFIGSHLADQLIAAGDSVVVLDDLSTGSLDNLARLVDHPRFAFVRGSVDDDRVVSTVMRSCDVVFHLAAVVGVRLVLARPLHTLRTNVIGTETVLEQAARHGRLVVIASTSEVYGKSAAVPFREDQDLLLGAPTTTRWGYAASKLVDEFLAMAYWTERRCPVVVARLFNTVGPRQTSRYGMVLPTFVQRAITGQSILVHGDGSQTRSFTWVGDTVAALIALWRQPRCIGEVFNVGHDQEIRIEDLAHTVKAAAASASSIVNVPYSAVFGKGFEDPVRRVPDISKLRAVTGFTPRVPIDEIVARTVAHWNGLLGQRQGPAHVQHAPREHRPSVEGEPAPAA